MQIFGRFVVTMVSLLILVLAVSAHAESVSISKNAIALSKAMISQQQFAKLSDSIVDTGLNIAKVKIGSEKLKVDLRTKSKQLEKSLRETFSYDHFINLSAASLSRDLSDDELSKILGFYNSPIGKKWTAYSGEHVSGTLKTLLGEIEREVPKMVATMATK